MPQPEPPLALDEHTAAHVAELFSAFSDTSQMRLVQARREGKEVYYRIVEPQIITLFNQGIDHVRSDR
jgi:DNA-binding transcriptional ArsR family regulator